MNVPREKINSEPGPEQDPRHFAPLPEPRLRAWDRARVVLEIVTPEQVFAAWREVKLANAGLRLGADTSYFDKCMADFKHKLALWLNQ